MSLFLLLFWLFLFSMNVTRTPIARSLLDHRWHWHLFIFKKWKMCQKCERFKKIRNYNTSLFVLWLLRKVILPILTLKFEEKFFQDIHIYFIANKKFFQKKNRRGEFTMRLWGLRICLVRWLGFLPFLGEREGWVLVVGVNSVHLHI